MKNLVLFGTFFYLIMAWYTAKDHVTQENEIAFQSWLETIAIQNDHSPANPILIAKTKELCASIDCQKDFGSSLKFIGKKEQNSQNVQPGEVYLLKYFEKTADQQIKVVYKAPNQATEKIYYFPVKP